MTAWDDAVLAARLLAVAPLGAIVRARPGMVRDRWLTLLRAAVPADAPFRKVPAQIGDDRLLGGLDLAATLRAGRPVAERGVLEAADGGTLLLTTAERMPAGTAAILAAALDTGAVFLAPARIGVIALDEGIEDEHPPASLLDRLALHLDLTGVSWREVDAPPATPPAASRALYALVTASDEILDGLCMAAAALGIASLRAPLLALSVARAAAALAERDTVTAADAALAARLVLAPRATVVPQTEPEAESPPEPPPPDPEQEPSSDAPSEADLREILVAAARAALPAGLLSGLSPQSAGRTASAGRSGAVRQGGLRGRPSGIRPGIPRGGARLSLLDTLRAAAPWQRLRGQNATRIAVRREDFRIVRLRQRREATTIFVVDASGSAAFNRLAEAKGAVELLLAECYVRRDRVALIAFRGQAATMLLPPTRSLTRAKRSLAALPGGGGTPLAAGLDAGLALACAVRRRGGTPSLLVLTDGQANVARDGTGGRRTAEQEAALAARQVGASGIGAVLIDVSPRPRPAGRMLAQTMRARYLPLPYADARTLSLAALTEPG